MLVLKRHDTCFTFIHAKTTPIKDPDESLIYSLSYSERPNVKRKLISTASDIETKVTRFLVTDKVGLIDHPVDQRSLAMVDMGDQRDISNFLHKM